MYSHNKFGIPSLFSIGDLLRTRLFFINEVKGQGQGHSDQKMVRDTLPSQDVLTQGPTNPLSGCPGQPDFSLGQAADQRGCPPDMREIPNLPARKV